MQERISLAYSETRDVLNTLYKKRKLTLFFQKIMWGITGIYFILMLVILMVPYFPEYENGTLAIIKQYQPSPSNPYGTVYPIAGLILLLYPTTVVFTRAFQKFKTIEKETMAKMVKMLFPNVEFTQGANAPTKEIVQSKLFSWIKKEAPIYSYGQIRSSANNTQVNIADIGIIENNLSNKFLKAIMQVPILNMFAVLYQNVLKNIATSKLADNTNYTYRGMFCWLNFKKTLNGHTVVLPKNQKVRFDRWASLNFRQEQEIHLEDPRFTENFIVYGTDQVEARYILSSSLMESVVALKEKFHRPIFMSFENKQMYLAVKNENGLFSFSSGKLYSIAIVEELAHEIEIALQVSETL
ncbi:MULTISPECIES: DUF3137 domain-containing protein [Flavobacteriaceae]|uniref:DUF3137 domain-containing protein n=1 Tax=Flavobacteriaceae TaxID=49546 RepID=UPI00234A4274|nr:DUF3137 domain-containing protein [Muricauda sp. SP22]MDC6363786.1 DUF3137 domain-containing protein [Muricauda sp. SP22]